MAPDDPDEAGRDHIGAAAPRRTSGALAGEIMNVLLAANTSLTGTEVLRRLAERDPAAAALRQTTILTILSRLQAHGLLTRTRLGRAYSYRPVADKPGLAARRMRRVLDDEADRNAVLARFVNDLSPHDEQVLRRLLTGELDS